ncbi:hypothetical protein KUTeg_002824 [Tegillarca granosa]|uniref:Histone acetyltransferase type B catalytic subunit n=1 Tax=Tegillarca granosa TaxID=220873 RepID=A0ABQ9FSF9_TEGGR|nr:hypothetical protein KUTeg_002824 [Tegillarca granosa]
MIGYHCPETIRQESDIEDDSTSFSPDMTHQIFGDQESIFGYRDLSIQIYYTAAKLIPYINMTYTDKVTPEKCDGLQADSVLETINKEMPPGVITNIDQFLSMLSKDADFKPYGKMLHSYKVIKNNEERHFVIYKTDIECAGFREYHERLQTFILYFIDAASYIDVDDERWQFYLFQMLVLPPFQRQGHGAQLIQTFYNDCYNRADILDITVEDPSENCQRVRDFVDVKNCMMLPSFQKDKLLEGFSEDMVKEAREKLKITKKQARRIYEILRLKVTDTSNPQQYRDYRLLIKKRLNAPFQKNGRDFQKLQQALRPDEFTAAMSSVSTEQRLQYLEKAFQEHVDMYRHIIERVAAMV